MRALQNILKHTLLITAACALTLGGAFVYFFYFSPRAGMAPEGARLERVLASPHFHDGEFQNPVNTTLNGQGGGHMASAMYDWLFNGVQRAPEDPLPVEFTEKVDLSGFSDTTISVTWFGHSTVLISIEGRTVLFDPMFSESAAPIPYLGQRFPVEREFNINALPALDAVVISHDHYDHLDHESVAALAEKSKRFFVPLGVGAHLESWRIPPGKITELDWWESFEFAGLTFSATPARHFSGRGLPASNSTLWASWVIVGEKRRVFFSGDSGYFPGFKKIGERFGPFDLCMIECGQYSENWPEVHMAPEESVRANVDLAGALLMPIHWGAFDLSLHAWNEPPQRMLAAAQQQNARVALPKIGQTFTVDSPPQERWWESVR